MKERKALLERTHQAKVEALASEREVLEKQVRFTLTQEQRSVEETGRDERKRIEEQLKDAQAQLMLQE